MQPFTPYQKFVVALLAFLQFTIILDFMILSPLGALLMPALKIPPSQFGLVVSAYAFAAGASGLMTAGFADRFDRKKLLLFFYAGFVIGTYLCALASTYPLLLAARTVTGLFGGVIGSITFAITTDLFPFEQRGRVMGFVQTSFAASQILGLPAGLYLSNHFGWHAPFLMIAGFSALVGMVILRKLRPIDEHLKLGSAHAQPFRHLAKTVSNPRYLQGFATVALLGTGGFMLMPFGSAFAVHNLGIAYDQLPWIYLFIGICAIFTGPLVGRAADRYGKWPVFCVGSTISILTVLYYTHLSLPADQAHIPLWIYLAVMALLFASITSRMIPAQALMSAVPTPAMRGAYMSISASVQQMSGGLASVLAGWIVRENADGSLAQFGTLGLCVAASSVLTIAQMYFIQRHLQKGPAPH